MKVLTTTPFLAGAPGESVTCRVRIENDHALASGYQLRVVGFDDGLVRMPAITSLPAGGVTEFDLELVIPDAYAPGNHALGVEVRSDRIAEAGSVAAVTVSVGSLDRLLLTVNPSIVRGHRSAKFWVDVLNRDQETVELELGGDSTDGGVRVKPNRVVVHPNIARARPRPGQRTPAVLRRAAPAPVHGHRTRPLRSGLRARHLPATAAAPADVPLVPRDPARPVAVGECTRRRTVVVLEAQRR